jgi:hypothetical protein
MSNDMQWTVELSADKGDCTVIADHAEIMHDGSLVFWQDIEGVTRARIKMAFAPGYWKAVFLHDATVTTAANDRSMYDKIVSLIQRRGAVTIRQMTQNIHDLGYDEAKERVHLMLSLGDLVEEKGNRTVRYSLAE